jgi:hypothetical protein
MQDNNLFIFIFGALKKMLLPNTRISGINPSSEMLCTPQNKHKTAKAKSCVMVNNNVIIYLFPMSMNGLQLSGICM